MGIIAQHVDDGNEIERGHAFDDGVGEHPGTDERVEARHGAGHVFDGLTGVESDFLTLDVDGMTAKLHNGHLHRVPGAGRRLFENEGHALARKRLRRVGGGGEVEDLVDLGTRQVVDLK